MLVSDYDGTFDADDNIENNVVAINRFRNLGNLFVLATGRALPSIKKMIDRYNITFDYLILDNGATVLDNNYRVLKTVTINDYDYKNIMNYLKLKRVSQKNIIFYTTLDWYVEEDANPFTKIEIKSNIDINQLYIDFKRHFSMPAYTTSHNSFEIMARGVNKAIAVKWLKYMIKPSNLYVIGDNENDLDMIMNNNGYVIASSKGDITKYGSRIFHNIEECINYIIKND